MTAAHPRTGHPSRVPPKGVFPKVPQFEIERLRMAWQDAVSAVYLSQDMFEPWIARWSDPRMALSFC